MALTFFFRSARDMESGVLRPLRLMPRAAFATTIMSSIASLSITESVGDLRRLSSFRIGQVSSVSEEVLPGVEHDLQIFLATASSSIVPSRASKQRLQGGRGDMPKLTQQMVDRATAPDSGQRFLRDARVVGLAFRVTSRGAKAWVWESRVKGCVRRITLGPHPALSLAVARDEALVTAAAVARGEDPAAPRARGTLLRAPHARPRNRSARQDERMLRDVLGRPRKGPALIRAIWRNRRLSDVTREDITEPGRRDAAARACRGARRRALPAGSEPIRRTDPSTASLL